LLLLEQLKDKGIDITHLDLGGGVGIDYEGEQTLGLNACCVFFINGQNLVIGIAKTGA
jgi:diaminopimelate decarboxylase